MRDIDFIDRIEESGLGVFTIQDVARLIKSSRSYVYTYLSRLESKNYVVRVERGKYALEGTQVQIIATNLLYPSYISFLSAFYFHGRTTQIPIEIDVICTKQKRSIRYEGYVIKFVTFQPKNVFGYRKIKDGGFWFLGDIEKSIIDSLYLPRYCSIHDVFDAMKEGIDDEKMIQYALKMGSTAMLKRVAFLLERIGIDVYDKIRDKINNKYDFLDPYNIRKGEKSKKWRLVINEVFE